MGMSMKGDAVVIMKVLIGIVFLILSIVVGINAWTSVAFTECWQDAIDNLDKLCLGGGIFDCASPGVSSEIEHNVKLGGCVEAVYLVNRENIAKALMDAGYGDSAECEWSLKSFIVMIPKEGSWLSVETVTDPSGKIKQKASGIVCKGYNTVLQDSNMKLLGPSKNDEVVEYCLTVRRLPETDESEYVFKVEASDSACNP
jgi:hypothetical protein